MRRRMLLRTCTRKHASTHAQARTEAQQQGRQQQQQQEERKPDALVRLVQTEGKGQQKWQEHKWGGGTQS